MKVVKFEFSLFGINTYVLVDPSTRKCAVVDPGMINDEERNALLDFVARNKLEVTQVINTHLHLDHAVGDCFVARKYNVLVAASADDSFLGNCLTEQARSFGIKLDLENVSIGRPLSDGDVIEIGEGRLKVIAVPGHSPGGIALYDEADGFVIAGDALFNGSIGRTDLSGGNHVQLLSSLRRKLLTLPPSTVVYPGHGPATTIGQESASNPFLR